MQIKRIIRNYQNNIDNLSFSFKDENNLFVLKSEKSLLVFSKTNNKTYLSTESYIYTITPEKYDENKFDEIFKILLLKRFHPRYIKKVLKISVGYFVYKAYELGFKLFSEEKVDRRRRGIQRAWNKRRGVV